MSKEVVGRENSLLRVKPVARASECAGNFEGHQKFVPHASIYTQSMSLPFCFLKLRSVAQFICREERFELKLVLFVQMHFRALFLSSILRVDTACRTRSDFPWAGRLPDVNGSIVCPQPGSDGSCVGVNLECLCRSLWDQVKARPAFDLWLSTKKASQDNYRNTQAIKVPLFYFGAEKNECCYLSELLRRHCLVRKRKLIL